MGLEVCLVSCDLFYFIFLPGDEEEIWKRWIASVPTRQTLFLLGLVALSKIRFRHMFIMNANSNCISVFWAAWKYGYSLGWTYWSCLPTSLMVSVLVPLKAFHPCPANRTDQSEAGSQVGTVSNAAPGFSKDRWGKIQCPKERHMDFSLFPGMRDCELWAALMQMKVHRPCRLQLWRNNSSLLSRAVSHWVHARISSFSFCQAVLAPGTPMSLQHHCMGGFTVSQVTECI